MNTDNDIVDLYMGSTVVVDPYNGKVGCAWLLENEELDVGQIKDYSDSEILELGIKINNKPVFLYYDGDKFKVSESVTKRFISLDELKQFIQDTKTIYIRWIKQHRDNGNLVISYHLLPEDYDEKLDNLACDVSSSIYKLMMHLKPNDKGMGDTKDLTYSVIDNIKNYPYPEKDDGSIDGRISALLTNYENNVKQNQI